MSTESGNESRACEQQPNSQRQNGSQDNNQQQNGQQQQGSMWKSILVRMFIFWMISNLFRGRQQSTSNTNIVPATNLFQTNQKIVSDVIMKKKITL